MRRFLSLLILTTALGVSVHDGGAAPPIDADPNKDYPIVPQAGNWMICVAYYTGPEAADLTRQMVYQLRSKLGLPAYAYIHVDSDLKRQKDEMEAAHQKALEMMRDSGAREVSLPKRTIHVEEQYAVLVGGWDKAEDAKKYLLWLSKQEAPEIRSVTGRTTREVLWELKTDDKGKAYYRQTAVNPFLTASVTRNPVVPAPRLANKPDPLLKKINEDNEYNLLECRRPWTLLVKEYQGASQIMNVSEGDKKGSLGPNDPGKALEYSAAQAVEVARLLRKLNFEAYVLHTRTSSIVAVGGFDGPNDPGVTRVCQQLDQLRQSIIAKRGDDPMKLFPKPLAVEIPRP